MIDGAVSDSIFVTSGVPQDLSSVHCSFLFSLTLLHSFPSPQPVSLFYMQMTSCCLDLLMISLIDVYVLQDDINEWTKLYGITLNCSKSCVLHITRSRNPVPLNLHLDGTPIPK